MVDKIVNHSKTVLTIAKKHNWFIGACYTNSRNLNGFEVAHFIDINWKQYDFKKHLESVKKFSPKYTVARDWEEEGDLAIILQQANILADYSEKVIIVPKVVHLKEQLLELIPEKFVLGYSVPTKYGGTEIETKYFNGRPVHLLGGRPEKQRLLAQELNVKSIDCNRFTLDARYGDYFNGVTFKPHPEGGYIKCLEDSIININKIWESYE
jgi:hypothetical protein